MTPERRARLTLLAKPKLVNRIAALEAENASLRLQVDVAGALRTDTPLDYERTRAALLTLLAAMPPRRTVAEQVAAIGPDPKAADHRLDLDIALSYAKPAPPTNETLARNWTKDADGHFTGAVA